MAEYVPTSENNTALKQINVKFIRARNDARRKSWISKTADLNTEKDGKKLWRLTKQLNDAGSRYSKITLIQDDTLIHGKTAANLFSDTYQRTSNIQVTKQQHRETRSELRSIGEPDDIPPVMDSPILYEELKSALAKLKLKKSSGTDCITNEMIINLGKPALYKLLEIYNK